MGGWPVGWVPYLRYAREAKARKRLLRLQVQPQGDPSLSVPQHLIDRVDDDSEEGSWSGPIQWGEEGWASEEEGEEESEVTDGEDDIEFNENAFEKLLVGAQSRCFQWATT